MGLRRSPPMHGDQTLILLEKRVREIEQLASDCILEGDVRRLQRTVTDFGKTASASPKLRRARVAKLTPPPRANAPVRSRAREYG